MQTVLFKLVFGVVHIRFLTSSSSSRLFLEC